MEPERLFWSQGDLHLRVICWATLGRPVVVSQLRLAPYQVEHYVRITPGAVAEIEFVHLAGNEAASGVQNCGAGTAVVNLSIQYLQRYWPPQSRVFGTAAPAEEARLPPEDLARERQRHAAFWRRFGLRPDGDASARPRMTARLGDLAVQRRGWLLERYPRFVDLLAFQHQPVLGG